MRSPSIEIASCCVTTSPSAENVRGARFSTPGAATPSISISDGGVSGSWTLASRSPLLSDFLDVETPDVDDADLGQPRQPRPRPAVGRRRADLEHRPQFVEDRQHQLARAPEEALQRPPWRPARTATVKSRSPARNAGSEMPSNVSGAIGPAADRPCRAQLDRRASRDALPSRRRSAGRASSSRRSRRRARRFASKKSSRSTNQTRGAASGVVDVAVRAHAVGGALEHHRRLIDGRRRAATAGRFAHSRTSSPCPRHRRSTAAAYRRRASRRRPWPPAGRSRPVTNALRVDVELAQHDGVAAAARKAQDRPRVRCPAASLRPVPAASPRLLPRRARRHPG